MCTASARYRFIAGVREGTDIQLRRSPDYAVFSKPFCAAKTSIRMLHHTFCLPRNRYNTRRNTMYALAINGSPRKNGNTGILLQEVLTPLSRAGWETELVQ